MPIQVQDQGNVGLGGSSISPRDTYSAPQPDLSAARNAEALSRSLQGFGKSVVDYTDEKLAQQKAEERLKLDGYVAVAQSLGSGAVTEAQLGTVMPDTLHSTRALVQQELGRQSGMKFASDRLEQLLQDPETRLDSAKSEAAFAALQAEAAAQAKSNPFWGGGYASAVASSVNQMRPTFQGERSKFYDQKQTEGYLADAMTGVKASSEVSLPGPISGSALANRLAALPAGETASAYRLAQVFLGASETENNGVLSAFLKRGTGKNIDPALVPWCAGFADSILAMSGNKTRGSLRAADFMSYGDPTTNPQVGDLVVTNPLAKGASGHVGFFAGHDDKGNVRILGGNQGDKVSIMTVKASLVRGFRTVPDFHAVSKSLTVGGTANDFVRLTGKDEADLPAVQANADALTSAKIPITNANLSVAEQYGPDVAVKIIKAADSATIKDVAPEAVVKTGDDTLTVSQIKQHASEAAGVPVDAATAAQNAVRNTDQNYRKSSSLSDMARRNVVVSHFLKQALEEGDDKWIRAIPPEWASIPAVKMQIDIATEGVATEKVRKALQARTLQNAQREDSIRSQMSAMLKAKSEGKDVAVYGEMSKLPNGDFDASLVTYAQGLQNTSAISPVESAASASTFNSLVFAAGTSGNSDALYNQYPQLAKYIPKGQPFTIKAMNDFLLNDTSMAPAEKIRVMGTLQSTMEGAASLRDPTFTEFFSNGAGLSVKTYLDSPAGKAGGFRNPELASNVAAAYTSRLQMLMKAYVADNNGKLPTEADKIKMATEADAAARAVFDDAKTHSPGQPAAPAGAPPTAKPGWTVTKE